MPALDGAAGAPDSLVDLCTASHLLLLFGLSVSLLLRQALRLGLLGGDPIRFVGRLLGQPFLLGRCLRERFGLRDASRVGLLLSELLERTRGLLTFLLRFRFGGGRRLRLPLGLLFGTSRFLRRFLSGGFPRCRLFGQACVEINQ